ncbi:MAG: RIO1 family regulatory kinase/ATPase [Nitrososphaerales archaeon]
MSSAQQAAKSIRDLEIEDWSVLKALEKSMAIHESVPLLRLQKETGYYREQVEFRLSRLNYWGFVMKSRYGYIMNTAGLDLLALHSFVEKGLISGMGSSVGMGKESDVFNVINDSGQNSVIKFYRIGRTSFRSTRKNRTYVSAATQHQWLSINVGAAQKEAEGLTKAAEAGVRVPHFIARDRHAVLMSKVDGMMLFRCKKSDVDDPPKLLKEIFANMKLAYTKAKMVNGDISEYNILYDGEPWIIDWPQFVLDSHANAKELLQRDILKPAAFFKKRFGIETDAESTLSFVTGKSRALKILQT